MISIFRYPGGKSKSAPRTEIFKKFPHHFSEYREPFVGGGGIFWEIDPQKRRWINDLNKDLVAVYRALQEKPDEFIAWCRSIPGLAPDEKRRKPNYEKGKARMRAIFNRVVSDPDLDPAKKYFLMNRLSFSGRVVNGSTYFSNPRGWNIVNKENALEDAADHLQGVTVTTLDFEEILSAPGHETLVYLDPPYMKDTLRNRGCRLYEHTFSMADHERLRDAVKRCSHRCLISYDDHPDIRDLYRDFNIYEASWTYSVSSRRNQGGELIITNYCPRGDRLWTPRTRSGHLPFGQYWSPRTSGLNNLAGTGHPRNRVSTSDSRIERINPEANQFGDLHKYE
jgi:DNA adenine methylase